MMIEYTRRDGTTKYGATHGEFGWILEDNKGMLSIAQLPGAQSTTATGFTRSRSRQQEGGPHPATRLPMQLSGLFGQAEGVADPKSGRQLRLRSEFLDDRRCRPHRRPAFRPGHSRTRRTAPPMSYACRWPRDAAKAAARIVDGQSRGQRMRPDRLRTSCPCSGRWRK